jgi:hypothetical protein
MSTTSLPPDEQQITDSLTAYHSFVDAFRGQLPFTLAESFEGNPDNFAPYPFIVFRIDISTTSGELDWFEKFVEVWNHKKLIEWRFERQPHTSDSRMICHYILAPKNANQSRDPWFIVSARHVAAQLGKFFSDWKCGLTNQTARLPEQKP